MHTIFSPDSRFMRIMGCVADLILLNLCYLLTCVPVLTIGAASAALYTVCFRFGTMDAKYRIAVCISWFFLPMSLKSFSDSARP